MRSQLLGNFMRHVLMSAASVYVLFTQYINTLPGQRLATTTHRRRGAKGAKARQQSICIWAGGAPVHHSNAAAAALE